MLNTIIIIYIIFAILLITFILINKGKGADTGGMTDTSMNDVFGSKGSNSILNKLIIAIAIIILILNVTINTINKNKKYKNIDPTIDLNKYEITNENKK